MKYRIIKRLTEDGETFYLVQHYDSLCLNWVTVKEVGPYVTCYYCEQDRRFTSVKEAKGYIKNAIKREKNLNTPATVVYEEEVE